MNFCKTSFFAICLLGSLQPLAGLANEDFPVRRNRMVAEEIEAAGVSHAEVLRSMRTTPRHEFMPLASREYAYFDAALPIGDRQTISPPFVVAYMTEQLDPQPTDRVLEIGTGSGYQAAVLSPLVAEVYTIEIVSRLGRRAERTLKRLGYKNVFVRVGDGYQGWPEKAPFDKIIVTCSPENIPDALVQQLREGGQMIIPVGERYQQNLTRVTKREGKLIREPLRATLFVPMTGQAEASRKRLPDPAHPHIVNGSFEQVLSSNSLPTGWHYLRQAKVIENDQSPEGQHFLRFTNREPGRGCRALQGMAFDGREVTKLKISVAVRAQDVRPGSPQGQLPAVHITFFDHRRASIGGERLGSWSGSFDWQAETKVVTVPLAAREAIVRLGLLGAVGRLDMDNLTIQAVQAP